MTSLLRNFLLAACLFVSGLLHADTVAHYYFGDGNLLDDSSGNSHTLAQTGTVSVNADGYSAAISLNSYLKVSSLNPGSSYTVSLWFRTADATPAGNTSLCSSSDDTTLSDTSNDWQLEYFGETQLRGDNGTVADGGSLQFVENTWYHVVVWTDGTDVKLYATQDGGSLTQIGSTLTSVFGVQDFRIGVNREQNLSWAGDYANVKVYDSALAVSELGALLSEGKDAAPTGPAPVNEIYIAFHADSATATAMVEGNAPTTQGVVVDTSADVWNNLNNGDNDENTFGPVALTGANGTASGASIRGNHGYAATNGISQDDKDAVMMAAWYGLSGSEALTVSNLPAEISGEYYVIVYGDANGTRTMSYTIGAETKIINDSSDFSGSFEDGKEYVLFSGLSGDSFTLTGASSGARSAVNGIQIGAGLPPTTITAFEVDDEYVTSGTEVEFSWNVVNYDSLILNPGNIDVAALSTDGVGSTLLQVDATTEYTLTATKGSIVKTTAMTVGVGDPRPNLIVFLVDDMGVHDSSVSFILDGNGHPVSYNFNDFYQTPNMETLASTGMRFTSAYAHTICSPSRASIMTGRTGARHAITNFIPARDAVNWPANWRDAGLDETDVTLPETLRQNGYRTIHCGKGHFSSSGSGVDIIDLGFDINIGGVAAGEPDSYTNWSAARVPNVPGAGTGTFLTQALATEANKAIEDAANDGKPFFLYMSFYAVHAVNSQEPRFPINPHATGDYSAALNTEHEGFATMVEGMDMAVGSIRQKVIDLGLDEDTFVIFLGDNGTDSPAAGADGLSGGIYSDLPVRGKKGYKWEGGARIPFIASWITNNASNAFQQARPIVANSIEDDLVVIWDVPVTMLAAAGISNPAGFGEDGHDLAPYFAGTAGEHRPQEIAIHFPHNRGSNSGSASYFSWIRKGDMKLIFQYANNSHELYDLSTDPTESINLATTDLDTTMELTRRLAQMLDSEWGFGPLKPTDAVRDSDHVIEIPNTPSVDLDGDGASDTTEDANRNGLVDVNEIDPDNLDTDADGTPDGAELELGVNPLDSDSFFYLEQSTLPAGDLQLTWPSQPANTFDILFGPDLSDWTTVHQADYAADSGSTTSYSTSLPIGGEKTGFFVVVLQ